MIDIIVHDFYLIFILAGFTLIFRASSSDWSQILDDFFGVFRLSSSRLTSERKREQNFVKQEILSFFIFFHLRKELLITYVQRIDWFSRSVKQQKWKNTNIKSWESRNLKKLKFLRCHFEWLELKKQHSVRTSQHWSISIISDSVNVRGDFVSFFSFIRLNDFLGINR